MRYKVKIKDCHLIVKAKASWGEEIDEKALDSFARAFLRGFLKPKVVKKNVVEYSGPVGISLYERLKNPLSKRDLLFVMEQIVVAVQKIQSNSFSMDRVVLDLNNVFINDVTKEIQFLYVPSSKGVENPGLIPFVESIIYSVKPTGAADTEFISRFNYFLKGLRDFNPEIVERYIEKEDPSVVNTIKKQNMGQSGFMTNSHRHYHEHYDEKKEVQDHASRGAAGGNSHQGSEETAVLNENFASNYQSVGGYDADATGLLHENSYGTYGNGAAGMQSGFEEEATGLLHENSYGNGGASVPGGYDSDATGLLHENSYGNGGGNVRGGYGSDATGLLNEQHFENGSANMRDCNNNEGTGLLHENAFVSDPRAMLDSGFGKTPLSYGDEEEGTALLNEAWAVRYPSLFRLRTQESISINKPVFRLGKERSYVDYFVTNNNAVSRSHADIVTRGNKYFVVDLNSKNHTYINDRMVAAQCETEIHDGDRLRLGNEEFTFHI